MTDEEKLSIFSTSQNFSYTKSEKIETIISGADRNNCTGDVVQFKVRVINTY